MTSWRAPHTFAADAVLLEVCRVACARGERIRLVDAFDRFGPERLRLAGLQAFAEQGLFEREVLDTMACLGGRLDAWRHDETEDAPDLLFVDGLVAVVESKICGNPSARSAETTRQG